MRKWWRAFGERMFKRLGWVPPVHEVKLEYAVRTKFRGHKTRFEIMEWQNIAQIFTACPDLEDLIQLKLRDLEDAAKAFSIDSNGDRNRLVNQAQREVLTFFATLPDTAAARVDEMLKAKKVPSLKGIPNVYS